MNDLSCGGYVVDRSVGRRPVLWCGCRSKKCRVRFGEEQVSKHVRLVLPGGGKGTRCGATDVFDVVYDVFIVSSGWLVSCLGVRFRQCERRRRVWRGRRE